MADTIRALTEATKELGLMTVLLILFGAAASLFGYFNWKLVYAVISLIGKVSELTDRLSTLQTTVINDNTLAMAELKESNAGFLKHLETIRDNTSVLSELKISNELLLQYLHTKLEKPHDSDVRRSDASGIGQQSSLPPLSAG